MIAWIRQVLHNEWRYLRGAMTSWTQDDGALMAAAVAYYVGLSFFPLLLVILAGFGAFLRFTRQGQSAEAELLDLISEYFSQPLHDHISSVLAQVSNQSTVSGPLGLLGLMMAALVGFIHFEQAFDRIWGIPNRKSDGLLKALRNVLIRRGAAFLFLLGSVLVIVLVFVAGIVLAAVQSYTSRIIDTPARIWGWLHIVMAVGINLTLFTLLYRWLTKVPVRWSEALRGGVLAALLWEAGRSLLAYYLMRSSYGSAYGVIGSFIAILLWCYYSVAVIFFGAEYIQQFCRACDDE